MHIGFLDYLKQLLEEAIISYSSLSGGDISEVYLLETSSQKFILKTHNSKDAYAMFTAEKQGLETIAVTKTIKTPEVFFLGKYEYTAFLVMEYVETKNPKEMDYENLGLQLAALHQQTNSYFGLSTNNFIGNLPQYNHKYKDWSTFYIQERLQIQLDLSRRKGLLTKYEIPDYNILYKFCYDLLQDIKPNLLHGDLWSGNFLIATDGTPYLIDPAVYYGHSEVDIAMSRLFGGFSTKFYDSYHSIIPKLAGNIERNNLYQLYYLLVHLNLFGKNYYTSVKRILNYFF